jgi:hypothetical protein
MKEVQGELERVQGGMKEVQEELERVQGGMKEVSGRIKGSKERTEVVKEVNRRVERMNRSRGNGRHCKLGLTQYEICIK